MISKYFKLDPFNLFTSPSKGEKIIWIVAIVLAMPTMSHVGFMGAAGNAILYGLIMILVYRVIKKRTCKYDVNNMSFNHSLIDISTNKASNRVRLKAGNFTYDGSPSKLRFSYTKLTKVKAYTPTFTGRTTSGNLIYGQGGAPVVYDDLTGKTAITIIADGKEKTLKLANAVATKMNLVTDAIEAWGIEVSAKERAEKSEMEKLVKQQKAEESSTKASEQATQYLKEWGMFGDESYYRFYYSNDGVVTEMLAALPDGRGGAVYDAGKKSWVGSWKNAVANDVNDSLEIQVDDPDYRSKHLKEHRFVIPSNWKREQRLEWLDRIRILSSQ